MKKKLIVVAGPTAVGKTDISIKLAQHYSTEILSADSRQFYRELQIGTATPSAEELSIVPHHFIGNLSISDYYNVSIYEQQALEVLNSVFATNDFAVVAGGSGLYIHALCHGIDDLPDPDENLRDEINLIYKNSGLEGLQQKLETLDPEFYQTIDKVNPKRLMRAIEVCVATGTTYTELRKNTKKSRKFQAIKIGLIREKQELYEMINARVDKMVEMGLLDEALKLLPYKDKNALNTVGYKELFRYFNGEISLEQAITDIKTNSRRYAKRQITWFKKDPEICWFHPDEYLSIIKFINEK